MMRTKISQLADGNFMLQFLDNLYLSSPLQNNEFYQKSNILLKVKEYNF